MLTDEFIKAFKELSFANRHQAIELFFEAFGKEKYFPPRALLSDYHNLKPKIRYDSELAYSRLEKVLSTDGSYIEDYDQPYYGGYSSAKLKTVFDEFGDWDKTDSQKWREYVEKLKVFFFEGLDDKTENFLHNTKLYRPNKKDEFNRFQLGHKFNRIKVLRFFKQVISEELLDYNFSETISSKKCYCWVKDIGNDFVLCVSFKLNNVDRELNMLYLDLPRLELDLLIGPDYECPLNYEHLKSPAYGNAASINSPGVASGMSAVDRRMGSARDDEQELINHTYFWFKQFLHFYRVKIKIVEKELTALKESL